MDVGRHLWWLDASALWARLPGVPIRWASIGVVPLPVVQHVDKPVAVVLERGRHAEAEAGIQQSVEMGASRLEVIVAEDEHPALESELGHEYESLNRRAVDGHSRRDAYGDAQVICCSQPCPQNRFIVDIHRLMMQLLAWPV